MEDYQEPEQPDLGKLVEDMTQASDCFVEYDYEHSFAAACIMDMAIHVLDKVNRDDASDIWKEVVYQMRWMASHALDCDKSTMDKDARAVMEAVVEARGHALTEAIMKERFASVGMTTTAQ